MLFFGLGNPLSYLFEVFIQMGFPMHTIIETRFELLITLTTFDYFFPHN